MSKKRIIMIAGVGLVSFCVAFGAAWLTSTVQQPSKESAESKAGQQEAEPVLAGPEAGTTAFAGAGSVGPGEREKIKMKEKQLKSLVYEVREKMEEYTSKLEQLEVREQRLQTAHNTLKKDIEELNNLQIELASVIANLKDERNKLLSSKVKIAQTEKANLMSISATYDKMDATSSSKILSNMCSNWQSQKDSGVEGGSFADAVKILHFMTERTKAKLLAELVNSEPELASFLCQRLKQVMEKK